MVEKFIICFILIILLFSSVFLSIKDKNTRKQRLIILHAFHKYVSVCINNGTQISFDVWDYIEDYSSTLYRLWDWGYTRILPPEKFELIKDYIKEK